MGDPHDRPAKSCYGALVESMSGIPLPGFLGMNCLRATLFGLGNFSPVPSQGVKLVERTCLCVTCSL